MQSKHTTQSHATQNDNRPIAESSTWLLPMGYPAYYPCLRYDLPQRYPSHRRGEQQEKKEKEGKCTRAQQNVFAKCIAAPSWRSITFATASSTQRSPHCAGVYTPFFIPPPLPPNSSEYTILKPLFLQTRRDPRRTTDLRGRVYSDCSWPILLCARHPKDLHSRILFHRRSIRYLRRRHTFG